MAPALWSNSCCQSYQTVNDGVKIPPNPLKLNLFSRQDLNLTLICEIAINQFGEHTSNFSLQEELNYVENGGGKSSLGSDTKQAWMEQIWLDYWKQLGDKDFPTFHVWKQEPIGNR